MKFRWLVNLLPLVAVGVALWLVHREIRDYSVAELGALFFSFPWQVLATAVLLTASGYCLLAAYDWIALRHLGRHLPVGQVMLAGFSSFAVSNTVGHALVSGGSLRYRFYSGWGLDSLEIAQVILLSTVTYFLANGSLLVVSYWLTPGDYFDARHLAGGSLHVLVLVATVLLAGYWYLVLRGRRHLTWRQHSVDLPGPGITLMQSFIGAADLLLAAAVLYVLLRQHIDVPFAMFLNAYLLAQVLGLFSQSPGGIGVFEGVLLYLLTGNQPSAEVMASLLMYRAIYYILPLIVAIIMILVHEFWQRDVLRQSVRVPWLALQHLLPYLYSLLMLVSGAILLFSATTPGQNERLDWIGDMLPVALIETSHLIATLTGLLILVMARAVRLKLRAAYYATLILLAVGIVACLLKGVDYEEAVVLSCMLLLLLPARPVFYRLSRLDQMGLTGQWLLVITGIIGLAIWIGFFAYRDVPYSHELWWQFDLHGDPSRFLRAVLVLVILFCAIFLFFFMRRSHHQPHLPDAAELSQADACVRRSADSNHCLVMTGDKHIFWNEQRSAFISYVTTSKYWIAIGDPCGEDAALDELLWRFREESDRFGATPVFYRVKPDHLAMYLDIGLTLVKIGEEAVVDLARFSLTGNARSSLRHSYNKVKKDGWECRVVAHNDVPAVLGQLRRISDAWLGAKKAREKGISLGFFKEDYLLRNDVAVVCRGEEIVAFANLWKPDNRNELSIDLMRYSPDAPAGAMEFLTISLMLWAKEQGYRQFNLGMAPLAGLESRALAPLWHKVGHSVFRYGNEFYNFQGLRAYKDKFSPGWVPMYLAVPSTYDVPAVMLQVASMIAGGMKGIFNK